MINLQVRVTWNDCWIKFSTLVILCSYLARSCSNSTRLICSTWDWSIFLIKGYCKIYSGKLIPLFTLSFTCFSIRASFNFTWSRFSDISFYFVSFVYPESCAKVFWRLLLNWRASFDSLVVTISSASYNLSSWPSSMKSGFMVPFKLIWLQIASSSYNTSVLY